MTQKLSADVSRFRLLLLSSSIIDERERKYWIRIFHSDRPNKRQTNINISIVFLSLSRWKHCFISSIILCIGYEYHHHRCSFVSNVFRVDIETDRLKFGKVFIIFFSLTNKQLTFFPGVSLNKWESYLPRCWKFQLFKVDHRHHNYRWSTTNPSIHRESMTMMIHHV